MANIVDQLEITRPYSSLPNLFLRGPSESLSKFVECPAGGAEDVFKGTSWFFEHRGKTITLTGAFQIKDQMYEKIVSRALH